MVAFARSLGDNANVALARHGSSAQARGRSIIFLVPSSVCWWRGRFGGRTTAWTAWRAAYDACRFRAAATRQQRKLRGRMRTCHTSPAYIYTGAFGVAYVARTRVARARLPATCRVRAHGARGGVLARRAYAHLRDA